MKTRVLLLSVLSGAAAFVVAAWLYHSKAGEFNLMEIIQVLIVALLVLFAVVVGIARIRSEKRGEPSEDELSRQLRQKAAATSFYISLYYWLVISFFSSGWEVKTSALIGTGILGMAILFGLSYLYHRIKGIEN